MADYLDNLDNELEADQRKARQQQAEADRLNRRQQAAEEKSAKSAEDEQRRQANNARESEYRSQNRPSYVDANGYIQPSNTDEEWQQAREQKRANAAAHDEATQSGRKFTTSKITGSPIYLESQQQLEARRAAEAEDLRKQSLDKQLKASTAEYQYRQQAEGIPSKPLTDKQKQKLIQQHQQARMELAGALDPQTQEVTGGNDWIPFNEAPSEGAMKAREQQARLTTPDTASLSEEELAAYDGNDATKPVAQKIRNIQSLLSKDEAARKFHSDYEGRKADLILRRDAPDKWAELQKQKLAGLSPQDLQDHLQGSSEDLAARQQQLQSAYAPLLQQQQEHEAQLAALTAENEQRRQQGIPAGEVVSFAGPDGQPDHWARDLAVKREALFAKYQQAQADAAPALAELHQQQTQLQQDMDLHNEGVRIAQQKQVQQKQQGLASLHFTPGFEDTAQDLQAIDAEHAARMADLNTTWGGQPPPAAVEALQKDVEQRSQAALAMGDARRLAAQSAYAGIQQQLQEYQANPGKKGDVGDLWINARKNLAEALQIPEAKAMQLLEDVEAETDWDKVLGRFNESTPATEWKSWKNATADDSDPRQTRILSNGGIVVNPAITDEAKYKAAVDAAKASPEAKAAALARYPLIRQQKGQSVLDTIQEIGSTFGPDVIKNWTAFSKQRPKDVSEQDWALKFSEKLKADTASSPFTSLIKRVALAGGQGFYDIMQQGSGAIGGVTGSQGLMQFAQNAGRAANALEAIKQLTNNTGSNFISRGVFDQLPRLASSILPAAEGAKVAQGGIRLLASTSFGSRLFPSLAAALNSSATPAQAVKAVQTLTRGGLVGSAAAGGLQTYGSQLAEIYGTLRKENPELTHQQALSAAQQPAILSAAVTALLTTAGGAHGVEKLLVNPAGAKELFKKQFTSQMQRAGFLAGAFANGAAKEWLEEIPDELFSQYQAAVASHPNDPQAGTKAISQFFDQLPELSVAIGLMGGGGETLSDFQDSRGSVQKAAATPAVHPANLPETVAAAEQSIDDLQMPDQPPEVVQKTQDAARGVLYVAQGTPLSDLDRDTLAALDIVEDPKHPGSYINGRIVPNTKTGVPEVQPYTAGMAPTTNADGTPGPGRPVRVRMENGQPVITQSTLDNLEKILPAVRAAIARDEQEQRTFNTAPKPAPAPAPAPAPSPEAQPPQATSTGAEATKPTPAESSPAQPSATSADAATPEEKTARASELATILEERGLTAPQAQAAAQHVVKEQGVVGGSAEEQFAQGIDDSMGRIGWVRGSGKKYVFVAPTLDASPPESSPGGKQEDSSAVAPAAKPESATVKESLPVASQSAPASTSLDPEAWIAAARAAKAKIPTAQRRDGTRIIGLLEKHLFHYAGAFKGVRFATTPEEKAVSSAGGGLHVEPNGSLVIDLPRIAQQFSRFLEGPTRSQRADTALRAAVEEEVTHSVQLKLYGFDETAALFQSLPPALQAEVWRSYRVTDLAARAAVQLFQKSYTELTPAEKARADAAVVTGSPPKQWSTQNAAQLYFEFERMLVSDRVFAGRVSEAAAADPSFGRQLLDWLKNIISRLRNAISTAPQEIRVKISEREAALVKALKSLQKSLDDSTGDARAQLKAKESKVDLQQDNRPSLTSGQPPQTTASNGQPPSTPFQPVLGAKGTAYTDANDAVDYQWAVVPVSALNISNDDTGRVNPGYPQELQPRDRTTAGSEAQVADIAKNMNLSRLSASSSVGDGAPIIGLDAVAESGNGRLMGMRRAWMSDSKAAQVYRSQLISTAASYGLNAEQVEAVPQPVLVRIRTTDLNRTAFVLSANVSTIAPKREIEQAKIDAKQIVPDIFEHFVPSEDGEIFTAANADFIRNFIATLIPPAERPAVIDAAGNLTQSGLRRIRNALFVYAYGSSPETLNALSRITESLESDSLRRLPDALVAMAPRFAELNARQQAGALYPLSITEDLAWVLQKLQDLRNRGESVQSFLEQDRIPGIGDDPTPLQRQLLTYLSENAARPRQIVTALSRYASAMDGAGDPRQASLFGDTRPTREELWALAASPREAALSTGTKSLPRSFSKNWTHPREAVLDALNSVENSYIHRQLQAAPSMEAATTLAKQNLRNAGHFSPSGHSWQGAERGLDIHIGGRAVNVPWKTVASIARNTALDGSPIENPNFDTELFRKNLRPLEEDAKTIPIQPANALKLYRKLKKLEAEKGSLESTQAQTLERAERALGQMFLFDQPGLQDLRPAPFRLESEPLTPVSARQTSPPPEQLRLFTSTKAADPRLAETFPDSKFDSYGFPIPPRTVNDPALLTPSIDKQTVTLETGHPLVAAGLLPAGRTLPRRALHAALVRFFMGSARPVAPGEQPVIVAMAGGGGAGKSTILNALRSRGEFDISNAVQVNADDIKELIPEYETLRAAGDSRAAATVHAESSHVSTLLMDRAMPPGGKGPLYNILFDGTLSNGPKSLNLIARWKAAGYHVRIVGVTIDPKEAIVRAFLRARATGRWVPLDSLVMAHNGFNEHIKEYGRVADSFNLFDNTPPSAHEVAQKSSSSEELSIVNPQYWSIVDSRRYEPASQTPAQGDSTESAGGQSSGESPGTASLRQVQSPAQGTASGSEGPVNLSASRKSLSDSGTPDLFAFNTGLGLDSLLTPAQKESKLQHAQTLDLFGVTLDAQPRPASQRPPRTARSSRPAPAAEQSGNFGELFAAPGMAGESAGRAGPLLGDAPGLAGEPGSRGDSAAGGAAALPPDGPAAGDTVEGADGSLSAVSGLPPDFDAHAFLRPPVGSPERNFEVPASVQSLAPATDKAKILANVAAIRLLKELEGQNRNPTPEEKQTLAAYTGWGAFKEAFNSKYEEDIAKHWDGLPEYRRQYMPEWLKSWEKNHRQLHKLLREYMSEDEFASASASTLNAHYTAAPIIRAMWKMVERLGFTGGRALEPSAGAGHYLGLQPESLADKTSWQTVELDDLSARLLSKLYPEATVNESPARYDRRVSGLGFERARIPNGSLDLAISNVPFHESGPRKKGFPNLNLHNFFFAHALDKVKPGGLVAFITSESTMQNNMKQREFIASKGDLVAAFRLPNNAFKGNAGTDVTTDIIILRKPDGKPFKGQPWRNLTEVGRQTITLTQAKDQTAEELRREAERTGEIVGKEYYKNGKRAFDVSAPIMVNEYFVAHPQNVLGQHTLASTMYRAGGYAVVAPDGLDVPAALDALIPSLPANVMQSGDAEAAQQPAPLASREDKPFSFKEENGKIYEVQPDGSMEEAEWGTNPELVKVWRSWKRLSEAVEKLVAAESSDTYTDATLAQMRRELNISYDTHVAAYKPVSRRFSNQHRHLYSDPGYPLTAALETEVITVDPRTGKKTYTYKKADIFTKRIGRPISPPKSAKSVDEALELSLAWQGRIDPAYAAGLLGITEQQFTQQALQRPDVFENPSTSLLEQAEEYLTGNVRTKLEAAEAAAQDNPRFQKNVEALRAAQPERKEIARISPVLGGRWIPAPVYNAFIKEVLHGSDTVEYIPAGNTWLISGPGLYKSEDFGTEAKSPAQLFKHALDMTEPLVYEGSGENRTFNPAATAAAKTALDKMRRAFIDFVKTSDVQVQPPSTTVNDPSQTLPVWQLVEDAFNESNNSYVTPRHTGTYLKFPGLNTDYVYTKPHRRAVIARFLNTRRGMMAHGVGSGKTFNQIIVSKELRRLGLAKKPLIVVQNATLGQFAKSYLKAYPAARILVPTKADFEASNRRKLVAKIATGNWDAVILPHSQFDLISNKPSAIKAYMDSQIDELMDIVTATKDKAKVRDLEGMIKRLKDRRQDMLDRLAARQDTSVMWEDLNIDALIMDEAHNYKSLPIITRMGRVKGVPASGNSQRAINFMLKCRDVQARTGGKNIFLATGTPIKNSMAEAYIMMQFMAPDILEEFHIHNFDDFATTYGQTVTEAEMAWGGTPKMETRFAKFQNGSSLVTMIRTMFDVAFGNEALGLDVPRIKGGEPEMRIIPATPAIDQFNAWTRSVNDAWKKADSKEKEEYTAVPIQTMAAGIAAALDPRLIAPTLPDDPQSKVNHAVRRALEIYKAGKARRTTQIIFSDLRNPFSMDYLMPFTGHPFPDYGSKGEFDLYKDIKAKLVAAGVPEAEVHLMQSGMTDVKKAALFEKVDAGEIRIIIGSTELLGVGVNIQTRLKAVHHLMPPRDFTPAMMEQRNGRIIRQGNLHAATVEGQPAWNDEVEIINYGTEGSMDSAIYGTLARKQRFITQLLMGENVQDTFDDPTDPVAVNMAEMAARTLGDPDFIRRITLEKEIKDLRLQAEAFTNEISGKRSRLAREESYIRNAPAALQEAQDNLNAFNALLKRTAPRPEGVKEDTDISDSPVYEFAGQTIDTASKDGGIINKLDLHLLDVSKTAERRGATKQDFTLTVNGHPLTVEVHLTLPDSPTPGEVYNRGKTVFRFSGAASLIQNLRRGPSGAAWMVDNIRQNTAQAEERAAKLRAKLATIGTFPDAEKLAALEQEAREVDERLRAKAAPPEAAAPALSTSRKALDSVPETGDTPPHVIDPYTGARSYITGSRVSADQGRAISHAHAQRLRAGLSNRKDNRQASPVLAASRSGTLGITVPLLREDQFKKLTSLPKIGEGAEAAVHADKKTGVVYKVLQGYAPVDGVLGSPALGVWPKLYYTADGKLDYSFAPAESPRQLAVRIAVQGLMGGTPTEIAGIGPEGHIILKQPLSPDAAIASDKDFIDNAGISVARGRSGIVEIPYRLLADDPSAPRVFLSFVEGRPWVLFDLHPDNFVGDHQGNGRINDAIVVNLTADLIAKVPGLAQVVKDAAARAQQLGDRSYRLFTASKSVDSPSMASDSGAAQNPEPSPGGLSEAEVEKLPKPGETLLWSSGGTRYSSKDRTVALAYANNPGFGGDGRIYASPVRLDKVLKNPDWRELVAKAGLNTEDMSSWRGGYEALDQPEVQQWLTQKGYDAVEYKDDFPDGAPVTFLVKPVQWQLTSLSPFSHGRQMLQRWGDGISGNSVRSGFIEALINQERPAIADPGDWMKARSILQHLETDDLASIADAENLTVEPKLTRIALALSSEYTGFPDRFRDTRKILGSSLEEAANAIKKQWKTQDFSQADINELFAELSKDAVISWSQKSPVAESSVARDLASIGDNSNGAATGQGDSAQPADSVNPESSRAEGGTPEAYRLFKSTVAPETTASAAPPPEAAPLARLGWNHLDRALSAKVAAHTRWVRSSVAETVARWENAPSVKPFAAAYRAIKKELFPDSVLPREVLATRREMEIKTAMGSQRAMDLVRALSGNPKFSDIAYPREFAQNPKHRRDLYEAMAGERPLSSLPPEMQALAQRLRALLVQFGQEAVKQGRMSLDTFENLRGTYMPHYYEQDVKLEKSLFKRFRLGLKDILAQRTTAWHITDNSVKDAQGEYRLVSHSGNQWRFKNAEHMNAFYEDFINQQLLDELRSRYGKKYRSLTAADLHAPSKLDPEVRGRMQEIKRQLHARYERHRPLTIGEQEKAGLIMDPVYAIARYTAQMAHDNATAEWFNSIAAKPQYVSSIASPGFEEIPDNPRFGRLAGKFVNADIAQQVLEMVEAPGTALHIYDTLLGWWKTGKTVLNPGTHVRNVLGNIFFSQLAGASIHNPANWTYYRQALQALRSGGPVLTQAYDAGVLGADFVSAELRQTLRQLLPDPATIEDDGKAPSILMGMGKAIGKVLPAWATNPLSKGYNQVAALYQAEDEVFKLAAFLKAQAMLGGDTAAAAAHVRQWFPYFDSGTSGTLKLLGRTAMPFLGFYRESIRIFGEALKHRPLALATGLAIPSLLTALSAMALGLDDDDLDEVKKDMRGKAGKLLGPTPLEGMPLFSILLPFRSSEGTLQQFDISAIHPFVDFLGNRVESGNQEDWWQKTLRSLIAAGPLGSLAYSQMTGRDTFGDRTFVENNMTTGEKLAARADNVAKTILPPLAPFGTGLTSLMHAGERSTNKTFETRNTAQTAARTLAGLDVRNATPDLYRLADDWRKAHGYEVQEGMDYGSTTPASRARKALFGLLAQDSPNPAAIQNVLKSLDKMGHPVRTEQDLNRLLFYRDPLKLIGGNKAKGITAPEAQAQFRASLHGEARRALESALTEYQRIKQRAPALILRK